MNFDELLKSSHQVQQNSLCHSTMRNYQKLISNYQRLSFQIPGFPQPYPLTQNKMRAFLEYYRTTHPTTTFGYLKQFVAGFSYYLRNNKLPLITQTPDFLNYLSGLQRVMHNDRNPKAKLPITKEIIEKISNLVKKEDIHQVEFMVIASLCFYGFLRLSECISLKFNQIILDEKERMVITLEKSKTNQTGKKEIIYIHKTNTSYSPFLWYSIYQNIKQPSIDGMLFSFTQSQFRYQLKSLLAFVVPRENLDKYASHSFRKGAAYTAALKGVQDSQIKAMGRWKSSCYQIYTSVTAEEAGEKVTQVI